MMKSIFTKILSPSKNRQVRISCTVFTSFKVNQLMERKAAAQRKMSKSIWAFVFHYELIIHTLLVWSSSKFVAKFLKIKFVHTYILDNVIDQKPAFIEKLPQLGMPWTTGQNVGKSHQTTRYVKNDDANLKHSAFMVAKSEGQRSM